MLHARNIVGQGTLLGRLALVERIIRGTERTLRFERRRGLTRMQARADRSGKRMS